MDVGKLDTYVAYDNEDLGLPKTLPNMSNSWYLLVYPIGIKAEFKTKSGFSLLLPDDTAKFKDPATGEYLPWCKAGDFAVFSRGSMAYTVVHEGKRFYVMPDDAIMYTVDDLTQIDPRYSYDPKEIEHIKHQVKVVNGIEG
jgi:hypothetical protein